MHWIQSLNCAPRVIGRAGASPPSRATGAQFYMCIRTYVRRCNADTVISISPSRATSCACVQFLSTCFVRESDNLQEIRFVSEVSTEESEASTTSYQQALRLGECQGKRKAPVKALHYNEFLTGSSTTESRSSEYSVLSFLLHHVCVPIQSFLDV